MSLADLDHSSSDASSQDGAVDDPQAVTPGDDAAGVPDAPPAPDAAPEATDREAEGPDALVDETTGVPGAEPDDDAPVPIYEEIVAELGDPTAPPAGDTSDA